MFRVTFFTMWICLFLTVFAEGQQAPKEQGVYDPSALKAEKIEIWKRFNQQYQNKWKVKWNPVTGTPHRISGYYIEIPDSLTKENIEHVTRKQLEKYQHLLQVDPEALVLSKADFSAPRRPEAGAGTWYVYYRQKYRDLSVYGGSVRLVIRNQKLTVLGSDYYPGIDVSPEPKISKEQAVQVINLDMGEERPLKPIGSELIVFPKPILGTIRYHLAWQITMPVVHVSNDLVDGEVYLPPEKERKPEKIPVQWRYFVDAKTRDIIERINLMVYEDLFGTVTGMIHPFIPADTPEEVPIANMTVTLTQDATVYTTETDADGHYLFTGLTTDPANFEAHLTGPHVEVHNDETPDPDATHIATVGVPGTHDWNWSSDDPSPNDVETNAFYHVNWIRDWFLRGDPFNITPDPYPMQVHVQADAGCNAWAGPGGLGFYSGIPGSCEDFGLCSDIIYHEYTHRIVAKIYDDAGVLLPYSGQTGAMNEGWSDYFGSSVTNDPANGEGCYSGRNIDTGEYKGVDLPGEMRFPDNWKGAVHWDGLIFSGAIWDARTVLGSDYVDGLALRAMKNAEISFSDYLGAVLEEDDDPVFSPDPSANNNPADGTPNINTICHAYYDMHGIYHEYCSGYTEDPIAIITSPAPLEFNLFNSSVSLISIVGSALGSSSDPLQSFLLEYAHESAPDTWLSAGVTLTGGGTSPVADAVLAQWDITGVGDGFYLVRLTVTDAGARTAMATTSVVIDNTLMSGWPQAPDVHFYGSPAVADLDPGYAGLEVVGIGNDYNLYVWHADGTSAPGWPQAVQWTRSAPSVGDLDGDGILEVVVSTYGGSVYAYHQAGSPVAGWPQTTGGNVLATPALGDLDGDGDLEVVIGSRDNNVYAWHHDGTPVAGWPITVSDQVESSVAIGDVDNDGLPEIVVGSNDGNVYVWRGDGSPLVGWPQTATDEVSASAALGDLDGDGDLEIVVGSKDSKVYAWYHDGSPLVGWPQTATQLIMEPSSATLADLDGDGDLEVVVMSNDDRIHVWQGDGTVVPGWPPAKPGFYGYEFIVSSPAIGDVDGDGDMEIMAEGSYDEVSFRLLFKIYGLHNDASPLAGWPKIVSHYSNSSPAIADIDQDGDVEIIIGSHGIFVWDLPGIHTQENMEWPFYRHDIRRTGTYGSKTGVALLFDVSGSMSWAHDGTMGVPEAEQRLTLAKEAAYPFMEMLNDFNSGKANFGIANFPPQPWSWSVGCNGQIVTPMTLITDASKNTAVTATILGLNADGNTPLLAGMSTAISMLGVETNQAIILLSDGYHNCPSYASVGDPEVTALIDQLNVNSIRVFTIGFGRPTDVDHPLLEAFADETTPPGFVGSQFYDVTTPGFDPATWDPATDLQATYKAILVDALGLETAADPRGIIIAGAKEIFEVKINEHDCRASFFLSWVTPEEGRLGLTIKASDGQEVPTTGTGIRFHGGKTYKIITVDKFFLEQPGKVGPTPWKIEIDASGLDSGERENYQYSVILDSGLKMKAAFDKTSYGTSDNITVTVRITEAGRPVTGLRDVYVEVTRPEDGAGNWYAENKVSAGELRQIPEKRGDENLSLVQRKAVFLSDIRKVAFPGRTVPVTLRLYDDGTRGDVRAGDGIYTNRFTNTIKEGTYSFYFHATGPTSGGNAFDRDDVSQKYVTVKVAPEYILVDIIRLPSVEDKLKQFKIVITPKDALGNYLGPRYSGMIKLTASRGRFINVLQDSLDGTYSQILQLPTTVDVKDVDIKVDVKGAALSFNLAEKLKTPYSVSFHVGGTTPIGNFNNDYDPGYSAGLNFDYHFTPQLSVAGLIGYNHFNSGSLSANDTYWWNISANLKYELTTNPLRPYVNGGPGIYIPKSGSARLGFNAALGLAYSLTSGRTIELGSNYHHIFTSGGDTKFFVSHIALICRF